MAKEFSPFASWRGYTFFILEKMTDKVNTWLCTHGGWSIDCDKEGRATQEWLNTMGMEHLKDFKLDNSEIDEFLEDEGRQRFVNEFLFG